nr:T9SS type A sorting domain-containing protein [uncultured Draconibacterium sp.]
MKYFLTKLLIVASLLFLFPSYTFSQTVDVHPRSNFSVNDTFKISLTIDSLLNSYTLDEIFSSEKKPVLEIQNVTVKVLSPDSVNYINEKQFEIIDRIHGSSENIILELTQSGDENVFVYNSHKTLSEFVGLKDNEFLVGIELGWDTPNWWLYWKVDNHEVESQLKTNSNSVFIDGGNINITPFDNLIKGKSMSFILSNPIKSNLNSLIEENTNDLLLEKNSEGENVFSQNIGLRNPIIDDFNGDGINDIVSQIYQYSVGDISTILTDDEKQKLISRWGVFLGTNSETDSLIFEMGYRYDEESEGSHFTSVDINNDGFSDLLSRPEWYHGLEENRPDYYGKSRNRPTMVYINDGNGNFSIDSLYYKSINGSVIQLDNDDEYEFIGVISEDWGENMTLYVRNDENDILGSNGVYGTNYQYIEDYENYDLNKDGFQDVIMLGTNSNDSIRTFTILVYYGSEDGVDLSMDLCEVIYEFEDIIKVDTEGNPLSILKLNGETDLLILYLFNSEYNGYNDTNGEFKTILKGFKITDSQLVDVTEDVFPDSLNINKLSPPNTPIVVDLDSDGLSDLCFNREIWFKGTEPLPISYLKNNGTYFEPRYFSTFDTSSGGFPSDVHFFDIDSDGSLEMIFDEYQWFNSFKSMILDLCFYPFEVIYENQSPTEINISNSSIIENSEEGILIGTLSCVDSDSTDTHSFYLVSGDGDSGNQFFTIKGNKILSNVMFDYESQNSYSIRVQTEDGKGGMFSKSFTIEITNEVEVGVQNLFDSDDIKIYPNPVTDKITVELTNSKPLHMIVVDGLGNKVLEQTLYNQSNEINLSNLVSGFYIMNLIEGNTIVHCPKFIKY